MSIIIRQDHITLNLKNDFVGQGRAILIHNGNTPKDSNGCLLINQADNNKENTLFNSKIAKEYFTNALQSNNSIRKYFDNIDKDEMIKQIEVRIENGFGRKQSRIPIVLKFNGKLLTIIINKDDKEMRRISFQAVSGRAEKINDKYYFTYEKERQMLKDKGPIPEREYYITPLSENVDDGVQEWDKIGELHKILGYIGRGKWGGRIYDWGTIRIPIQPKTITLTNSKGQIVTRNNFFIHGGWSAGSAGCIDLWDKNEMFFEKFLNYVEQYKDEILKNQGKIPLIVKYEDSTKVECDNATYTKYCKPIH